MGGPRELSVNYAQQRWVLGPGRVYPDLAPIAAARNSQMAGLKLLALYFVAPAPSVSPNDGRMSYPFMYASAGTRSAAGTFLHSLSST